VLLGSVAACARTTPAPPDRDMQQLTPLTPSKAVVAPVAPRTAGAAAPTTQPTLPSHPVVGLVKIDAPHGDIAAPDYVSRFTVDLHRAGRLVDCATAATCHADVIISGTLVHSSEGDYTEIDLDSVVVATSAHRSWHDMPLDSDQFFAEAAARAYAALVP
jgi:hypothetical protein